MSASPVVGVALGLKAPAVFPDSYWKDGEKSTVVSLKKTLSHSYFTNKWHKLSARMRAFLTNATSMELL